MGVRLAAILVGAAAERLGACLQLHVGLDADHCFILHLCMQECDANLKPRDCHHFHQRGALLWPMAFQAG